MGSASWSGNTTLLSGGGRLGLVEGTEDLCTQAPVSVAPCKSFKKGMPQLQCRPAASDRPLRGRPLPQPRMSYSDLMRTRLFEPLRMSHTAIQDNDALVAGGKSQTGITVQPRTFDAYAPAGAAVFTAPGMAALRPTTSTLQAGTRMGDFWAVSTWQNGQIVTWHTGQTGGYTSYFGLDRAHHKAVVVLSNVAIEATTGLGIDLLALNA